MNFAARLDEALTTSKLCVGIDPHPANLENWAQAGDFTGLLHFATSILDAAHGITKLVKFQVSLFEAFGIEGMRALSMAMKQAREMGFLVIADAKRGDIGTSMDGYQRAWLEPAADFESDALTVSGFLGISTLEQTLASAAEHAKGLFVLVATSNPEAQTLQSSILVTELLQESIDLSGRYEYSLGVVIGATVSQQTLGIRETLRDSKLAILAPGFGAQGVPYQQHEVIFGPGRLLIASSRDIADVDLPLLRSKVSQVNEALR